MQSSTKNFTIGIYTLFITFLITLSVHFASTTLSGEERILHDDALKSFNGKVDSSYYDSKNHNTKTIFLSDKISMASTPNGSQK